MANNTLASLIMDLSALAIVALCAAYYSRKGFVASIFSFFGTLIALVLASMAASNLAPAIFNAFFRQSMEESLAASISQGGIVNVSGLLESLLGFLPDHLLETLEGALNTSLDFAAPDIAKQAVDSVMAPLITPFITIILFFILFSLLRVLMGVIRSLAVGLAKKPAMNTVNSVLGAVVGLFIGILYVYLILCAIWAYDSLNPTNAFGQLYFGSSMVWKWLSNLNFFANI